MPTTRFDTATPIACGPIRPLTDTVALLTGAGRGIGAAAAHGFVRAGAAVVLATGLRVRLTPSAQAALSRRRR